MNRRTVSIALLAPSASLAASAAAAQQFPTRPLRLIVGFPPGMGPDSIAPSSYARLPYDPQKHFAPGGLVSGSVQATFVTVGLAAPQAKGGKLRALATTGKERSTALPDTPTLAEASYPKLDFTAWFGFVAPCKTPPDVLDALNTAVVKAVQAPEVRAKLEAAGFRTVGSSRADFARLIQSDAARWGAIVKATGFQATPN